MDKESLLSYFQTNYYPKKEVLFRLPLSIDIDSFWAELISRRKTKSQVLPLRSQRGMPYWYTMTDKMIQASERLCEEVLKSDIVFDPYRTMDPAAVTPAMQEDIFYTSYVEGANIDLADAYSFLQSGNPPGTIYEQMLLNNKNAWHETIRFLDRPVDEAYVMYIARILTEGMDNFADGYRKSDIHPIAAMADTPYTVPSAAAIPSMMQDFYIYMQDVRIHPLLKAAVGQAYILVTRPFSEGNERLSRILALKILLRCGYDFFRDISISAAIAQETYLYYRCMREIISGDNGEDLTYFIEYYLELLVRAVDWKRERDRKKQMDDLSFERSMAQKPINADISTQIQGENKNEFTDQHVKNGKVEEALLNTKSEEREPYDELLDIEGITGHNPRGEPEWADGLPEEELYNENPREILLKYLQLFMNIGNDDKADMCSFLIKILETHEDRFTMKSLKTVFSNSEAKLRGDLAYFAAIGVLSTGSYEGTHKVYTFSYGTIEKQKKALLYHQREIDSANLFLRRLDNKKEDDPKLYGKAIEYFTELIEKETWRITVDQWAERFKISKATALRNLNTLTKEGVLLRRNLRYGSSYIIHTYPDYPDTSSLDEAKRVSFLKDKKDLIPPSNHNKKLSLSILCRQRLAVLSERFGENTFTLHDIEKTLNVTKSCAKSWIYYALGKGLLNPIYAGRNVKYKMALMSAELKDQMDAKQKAEEAIKSRQPEKKVQAIQHFSDLMDAKWMNMIEFGNADLSHEEAM